MTSFHMGSSGQMDTRPRAGQELLFKRFILSHMEYPRARVANLPLGLSQDTTGYLSQYCTSKTMGSSGSYGPGPLAFRPYSGLAQSRQLFLSPACG